MKALIQLFYLLHVGISVEELMWCFNNSFPAAFLQGIIKYEFVREFSTRAWPVIEFDYIVRKSISESYFSVLWYFLLFKVFGYLFHFMFWIIVILTPIVAFDVLILLIYFSLSTLLKEFYVEQHKWEYTKGDRQYYVFVSLVSWAASLLDRLDTQYCSHRITCLDH